MRYYIFASLMLVMTSAFGAKVIQPTTVPGKWEPVKINQFPPLKKIVARKGAGGKIYGLYSWAGEYMWLRKHINKVGWKQCRIAGPWGDKIMEATAKDGIEVMPTLGIHLSGIRKKRPDFKSDDEFINHTIQGIEKFLKRYGPDGSFFKDHPKAPKRPITHIEIWNEPNFQYMIPPDKRPRKVVETEREKLYAKLLKAVYKKIKAHWPKVQIVAFAAGGESCGDLRFIDHVHDIPDAAQSYDILSTHPYVGSAPPEAFSVRPWGRYSMPGNFLQIRQTMKKHGRAGAPVWYTEVGWPISQKEGGRFEDRHKKRIVPKILQAAYIVRTYALALRMGVQRVNIMFIVDSDGFNGGFFTRSGKWRPAAYAVQTMIKLMPNPHLTGALSDGEDGCLAYIFNPDSNDNSKSQVIMLWNVAGPRKFTVPCKGKVKVFDMLGNLLQNKKSDGSLTLQIGPCPVYVIVKK
jgi:hypothetical protein